MKKLKCEECGKVIEGFTEKQVEFLMMQHKLSHRVNENQLKKEVKKK